MVRHRQGAVDVPDMLWQTVQLSSVVEARGVSDV